MKYEDTLQVPVEIFTAETFVLKSEYDEICKKYVEADRAQQGYREQITRLFKRIDDLTAEKAGPKLPSRRIHATLRVTSLDGTTEQVSFKSIDQNSDEGEEE